MNSVRLELTELILTGTARGPPTKPLGTPAYDGGNARCVARPRRKRNRSSVTQCFSSFLFIVTDRRQARASCKNGRGLRTKPMYVRGVSISSSRNADKQAAEHALQPTKENWSVSDAKRPRAHYFLVVSYQVGTDSAGCRQNHLHSVLVVDSTFTSSISLTGNIHTGGHVQSRDSTRNAHLPYTRESVYPALQTQDGRQTEVSGHIEVNIRYPTGY